MEKMIFVSGGPRMTHPLALECGFDAGFGVGTKPSDVASYIVDEYLKRKASEEKKAPAPRASAPAKKTPTKKAAAQKKPAGKGKGRR
jgi:hypothetical protein